MPRALAYNVFARRQQPALCCAIAQGSPVPPFIEEKTWEFSETVQPFAWTPDGFQPECAREAIRVLGYYLFHSWARA
jgi:hypothetical protein